MKFITFFDPKSNWDFVGKFRLTNAIALTIPILSLLGLGMLGINWGIDFSGGTEMQVRFEKEAGAEELRGVLSELGFAKNQVQSYGKSGDHEMLLRVERVTTLSMEDVKQIEKITQEKLAPTLPDPGLASKITATFEKAAGDRVTLQVPLPKTEATAKKKDPQAIDSAIRALGDDKGNLPPIDDVLMDAFSKQGFAREAVIAKAKEIGLEIKASPEKQKDEALDEMILLARALNEQEAVLAKSIDKDSGFRLRRTKQKEGAEASIADAIMRSQPHEGTVKYIVHFEGISAKIGKALDAKFGGAEIRRVDYVDSQVSKQLRTDGALAIIYALLAILVYVAIRFDILFSPGAVVALVHDSLGALALFAFARIEFDLPSVAALLTVVGYSINNTIVIYDRVREIMPTNTKRPLSDDEVSAYVNQAINSTFSRTINTTLTTLFASVALFFLAGGAVQNFAAVLSIGILLGGFSSTCVAPATYLSLRKRFFDPNMTTRKKHGHSREDRERGIV